MGFCGRGKVVAGLVRIPAPGVRRVPVPVLRGACQTALEGRPFIHPIFPPRQTKIRRASSEALLPAGQTASTAHTGSAPLPAGQGSVIFPTCPVVPSAQERKREYNRISIAYSSAGRNGRTAYDRKEQAPNQHFQRWRGDPFSAGAWGDARPEAQPAVPAASAFGPMETRARPTSRGLPSAALCDLCAAKCNYSGIAVFAEANHVRHCARACVSFLSARKRFSPFFIARGSRPLRGTGLRHGCVRCLRAFIPDAEGKVGGNDASLPCGARICCRFAQSTLFAPAGQKRCRAGAPDFGRVAGESCLRSGLPIRNGWQARREDGSMSSCAP